MTASDWALVAMLSVPIVAAIIVIVVEVRKRRDTSEAKQNQRLIDRINRDYENDHRR